MRTFWIVSLLMLSFVTFAQADKLRKHPKPGKAHEIIPGLWQGARLSPGSYDFNVIVFGANEWQPKANKFPGSTLIYAGLSDVPKPTAKSMKEAVAAATAVAAAYEEGKTIIVTCGQGYNRSGLVTALALRMLGYESEEAIALIRKNRGRSALRNKAFLKFVRAFVVP
jgi:protein-tyrosine phosphatase